MRFGFSKISKDYKHPENRGFKSNGAYVNFFKPLIDKIFSLILLIILSPLLILVALFITLESKGPILFKQTRIGYRGKVFYIYKFRSMTVTEDGHDVAQAQRSDTRITKVGRFIRKTSIDELPQLLNVLFGDMSLVGPRPHALSHDLEFTERVHGYQKRHHVLPGITGLAQVNGYRGPTADDEKLFGRIESDITYTQTVSFWTDIKILFKTVSVVFNDKNAF